MGPASGAIDARGGGGFRRVALGVLGLTLAIQLIARVLYRLLPIGIVSRVASVFDRPFRRHLLGPVVVARRSGVRSGMRVLQVSPGDGALTEELSRIVGGGGRVEAVALDRDECARARAHLDELRIDNASVIPGDGTHLPFDDTSFDAACVVSALGRVCDASRLLAEITRVLRPAGRFSASEVVSDPAYRLQTTVVKWGELAGFEPLEHFGNVVAFTVNFRKPRPADTAG
jgi:ubiquinone/menaquinone biosynthesis C-methylase UbiE